MEMRSRLHALVSFIALAFVAGCAASTGPVRAADFPDDVPACIGDDDCVVTTVRACCEVCPAEPRVVTRVQLAEQEQQCAAVECPKDPTPMMRCPKVGSPKRLVAHCVHERCRMSR